MIGSHLNHYEIVRKAGSGGMGEVWVARDTKLDREVALKVLPPELAGSEERLERFQREARALAALNHPNIVTIYSVEEADDISFMTMELVRGQTLDQLIPEEGLAIPRFLEVAIPLVDAIAVAHDQGIQHRDLKPANVMVTEDGRVKVLDFGLAKLKQPQVQDDSITRMVTGDLTVEGKILGTIAYMSPEQAEGRTLDHRSDIFSLGVLLYELLTGRKPFAGTNSISVLSSILKDEPDSVSDVRDAVPVPVARIIHRALIKKPEQRYQSARDMERDLRDFKRDLDTGEVLKSGMYSGVHEPAPARTGVHRWVWLAGGAVLLMVAGLALPPLLRQISGPGRDRGDRPAAPRAPGVAVLPTRADVPGVAVFYFDNVTDDEELEWLRTGLPEMLVTDLSQRPGLRVVGTDRLYTHLDDMGRLEDRRTSFDVVREISQRERVGTAVVGSFTRAGNEIRIDARVQDAATGDVMYSERVSGTTDQIFALVDDLSARVSGHLDAGDMSDEMMAQMTEMGMGDRKVAEVTTRSVDAFRLYNEGVKLNLESKETEAIPLLERAVQLDPEFAMALAKLSVAYGNNGDTEMARQYASRAYELSDRLPPAERLYIKGRHFSLSPDTSEQAIEAYGQAVELFPDHMPSRNNLAANLIGLGRFEEAIPHLEKLVESGTRFAGAWGSLADAYLATGRLPDAVRVLRRFVTANPDNAQGRFALAQALARSGRLDEASDEMRTGFAMRPSDLMREAVWAMNVMNGDWEAARGETEALLASPEPRWQLVGRALRAREALIFGRVGDARAELEAGRRLFDRTDPGYARALAYLIEFAQSFADAGLLLETAAELEAVAPGPDNFQAVLSARALGYAIQGNEPASRAAADALNEVIGNFPIPDRVRQRVRSQLDGILGWARRDREASVAALRRAIELDPSGDTTETNAMRFYLGQALWELGRREEAAQQFGRIEQNPLGQVEDPVAWTRALYYLGASGAASGNREQASSYYKRFLSWWGDGEIDRERVAEARAYVQ